MKNFVLASIIVLVGMFGFTVDSADATGFFARLQANRARQCVNGNCARPVRVQRQKVVVEQVFVPQRVVVRERQIVHPQRVQFKEVPQLQINRYGHGFDEVIIQRQVKRQRQFIQVEKVFQPQKVIIQQRVHY